MIARALFNPFPGELPFTLLFRFLPPAGCRVGGGRRQLVGGGAAAPLLRACFAAEAARAAAGRGHGVCGSCGRCKATNNKALTPPRLTPYAWLRLLYFPLVASRLRSLSSVRALLSRIQDAIRRTMEGTTLLTIAHRLNTVVDYDRIIVMDRVGSKSSRILTPRRPRTWQLQWALVVDRGSTHSLCHEPRVHP